MRNITILVPDSVVAGTISLVEAGENATFGIRCAAMDFNASTVYNFIPENAGEEPVDTEVEDNTEFNEDPCDDCDTEE